MAGAKLKALRTDHVSPALGQNEDLLLSGRVTKECIDYLARRYDPICRTFFDRKAQKKNRMVAHQALAHKLARAAYYIMRDGVAYQQEKLFGQRIGWGGEPEQGLAAQPRDTIGNRPSR